MKEEVGQSSHWLDRPGSVKKLIRVLAILCLLVVAGDLVYEKHGHYSWENFPGSYAILGFSSCVAFVLGATLLRRILKRGEDYYD
jgi:hypothetical protein